jgi:ATP adenylyltransferase
MQLVRRSMAALREIYGPEGFNIGINQGGVAGVAVQDDVHRRAAPRWGGATDFQPGIGDVRVLAQSLSDSWKELRRVF